MQPSLMSYVTLALTAIVLAALAFLALAPPFLDWNRYRDSVAQIISHALGEAVRLEGDIALRMLPSPSLVAEQVDLGPLVHIDVLQLETDWLSLLDGSLQINRAVARGMEAQLFRQKGEEWHLPMSGPAQTAPLKSIEVETSKILVQDEERGIRREISLVSAQVESGRLRAVLDTSGSPFGDSLELRLALERGVQSAVSDISLQAIFPDVEMGFKGKREDSGLNGEIKAEGEIAGQEVHLRGALRGGNDSVHLTDLMLQWGNDHWRGGGEVLAILSRPKLDFSLRTGIFDLINAKGIRESLEYLHAGLQNWVPIHGDLQLQVENLLWDGETLGEGRLTAGLSEEKFTVDIALEKLSGGGHIYWEAQASRRGEELALTPLVGDLTIHLGRPERFPHMPFLDALQKPFLLDAILSWSHEKLVLDDINLDYGESLLHGGIAYNSQEPFDWQSDWNTESLVFEDGKELFHALAGAGVLPRGGRATEGRLSLDAGSITADGRRSGSLTTRMRLFQDGVVLETLRLGERPGFQLEMDGFLFWRGEDGVDGRVLEGQLKPKLHLPDPQAREDFTALLKAFDVKEANLLMSAEPMVLEGEWKFDPRKSDRIEVFGTAGGGSLQFEADGILPLLEFHHLREGEGEMPSKGLEAPVRASWRQENDYADLEGRFSPEPEFFQARLQAGGEDIGRFLSYWLASREKGAPGREAKSFVLQADLVADSDSEGKRLSWRDMKLSYSAADDAPADDREKEFTIRGEGWIAEGEGQAPFRLTTSLEADEVVLAGWDFLSFFHERHDALPASSGDTGLGNPGVGAVRDTAFGEAPVVLATRINRLRVGDLPLAEVTAELFADFAGGRNLEGRRIKAQGRLFDGEAEFSAGFSGDGETRWLLDVRGLKLQEASSWLWDEEILRGGMDVSLQATGDVRYPETLRGLGGGRLAEGEICCIDIDGLQKKMREGNQGNDVEIGAFATPRLGGDIWTRLGTGDFIVSVDGGLVEQRYTGSLENVSNVVAELNLAEWMLRLEAGFPVFVGEKGNAAQLGFVVEGELFSPSVSFDDQALEISLEELRLEQALEELEAP